MGIGVIILIFIVALAISAMLAPLTKDRKGNFHKAVRRFFLAPPLIGTTDPRKSGFWYTTNWFAGEKVNEAIMEGKERSAQRRSSHHAHSQQKRSRHGR
jgi:hypothetical protein